MISFFKKQDKPEVTDFIYMSRLAKYQALYEKILSKNTVVLVYYFKDSWAECKALFNGAKIEYNELPQAAFELNKINCISAEHLPAYGSDLSKGYMVFIEHFPSYNKEAVLLQHLFSTQNIKLLDFYTSLDEPLFILFGGEKITGLMQKLGMKENEAVSHSMVTQSLVRAQQKIDENLHSEIAADNGADWIRLNVNR